MLARDMCVELQYLSLALTLFIRNWSTSCSSIFKAERGVEKLGQISSGIDKGLSLQLNLLLPLILLHYTWLIIMVALVCHTLVPIDVQAIGKSKLPVNSYKIIHASLFHSHSK